MFVRLYACEGMRMTQTFEAFCEAIAPWPGMYVEPDGSFVWVVEAGQDRMQLDGMIYDRGGAIEYVELKGECGRSIWGRLCTLLVSGYDAEDGDWDTRLRVHDVERGLWLEPSRYAMELEMDL